jgi:hypothetical protein
LHKAAVKVQEAEAVLHTLQSSAAPATVVMLKRGEGRPKKEHAAKGNV